MDSLSTVGDAARGAGQSKDHDVSQAWDLVQIANIALQRANLTLTDDSLAADRAAIRDSCGRLSR